MHQPRKWNEGYFIVRKVNDKDYYFVDIRDSKKSVPAAIWNANETEARAYSTFEEATDDIIDFDLRDAVVRKLVFDI